VWELPTRDAPYVHESTKPRAAFIAGGLASGKTAFRGSSEGQTSLPAWHDSVHIDLDEIKTLLPEFERIETEEDARAVHVAAVDIARRLLEECLRRGVSLTLEGAGSGPADQPVPDHFANQIRRFVTLAAAAGRCYEVDIRYCDVPIEEALRRIDRSDKYRLPGWTLSDFDFLGAG